MTRSEMPVKRRLHAFVCDPSVQRTTYRLYQGLRAVGLAKHIGGGFFFSTDGGFAWTGHDLKADTWAMASCLRDHKNRVLYSGDVVIEKRGSTVQKRIVVVDDQRETWLYQPKARQLEGVDARSCRSRWSKLTFVESDLGIQQGMRQQIDHALRTLGMARELRLKDVILFTAAIGGAALGAAIISFWSGGSVGFVVPLLASVLAAWGLHRFQMMQKERLLSRSSMLALTHRVALFSGSLVTLVLAGFGLLAGASNTSSGFGAMAIVWIASVFAAGVICLLSGDLATWQCGGYPGEGAVTKRGGGR